MSDGTIGTLDRTKQNSRHLAFYPRTGCNYEIIWRSIVRFPAPATFVRAGRDAMERTMRLASRPASASGSPLSPSLAMLERASKTPASSLPFRMASDKTNARQEELQNKHQQQ